MTEDRLPHRLSVVWFTDLVGYSRMSAQDEDRAIALVRRFQAAMRAAVLADRGRIVKFIGDAALVESSSAESALVAAAMLRESLGEGEAVRTGVHLGDVAVAPDGDLYGDGVNTAQRIQTEAEPGQIVVSELVALGLRSRPAFRFEPLGVRSLKGVEPVRLFLVTGVATAPAAEAQPADRRPTGAAAPPARDQKPSIAVLPFANLSADPENEYFSDGITEEILTALTKLGDLKVISRTSIMQYKGTSKSVREIGGELGVGMVLEGSVRRAGNRVRITAQLIDAGSDEHLWAENYDRDLDDIFAIQSDVAQRIVETLKVQLTPRERARIAERPTEDVQAYEWYLKGRHFLSRRTVSTLRQAIECFRKAVAADPSFAEAWVGLADGLVLLATYSETPLSEVADEARAAAERALALSPDLGEAEISLGFLANSEWQWEEAERRYRRGLDLRPGYATGHHRLGNYLALVGRHDEALATLRRALSLDPLSLPMQMALGTALWLTNRPEEALEVFRRAIELDPGFAPTYQGLSLVWASMGRFEEALEALLESSRLTPDFASPEAVEAVRVGYAEGGVRGFWEALLRCNIQEADPSAYIDMAAACAQLGREDEAFEHLERFVASRYPTAPMSLANPLLAPLRSDPRFTEIKCKLGLG
ncbi:MAG TPA: adenylate/guanylate cyclase domain-containing protein [Gemmatimonadota bacterium]|nr:adenylate/guanylate cyclase domain-containing protein [Gemmatimonadota bacterium]